MARARSLNLGRRLRDLANRLDPVPMPAEGWSFPLSHAPAWDLDDSAAAARRVAAVELLDEDTMGYLVLRVRREDERNARVELRHGLDEELWPAVVSTLARIVLEAER